MSHIPLLALALCHYQTELYIYVNPSRIKKCRTHTELYCLSDLMIHIRSGEIRTHIIDFAGRN